MRLALAAAGATFQHVVKTNLYVVGLKTEHVPIIREVRSRTCGPIIRPSARWSASPPWSAPTG